MRWEKYVNRRTAQWFHHVSWFLNQRVSESTPLKLVGANKNLKDVKWLSTGMFFLSLLLLIHVHTILLLF